MRKEELRKIYLQKRLALTQVEYNKLNKELTDTFFKGIDLSGINVLHSFLPIEKTKEPDTWQILNRIIKEYPQVKLSVRRINNQTSMMDNFYLEGPHQLEKNTWGIPEPKEGIPTPTEKIDAVLVPMLAFDKYGNRVGYGRGFYDKFLATVRPDCKKIGLCFFANVSQIEGMGQHDLPLDVVVTPERVVTATKSPTSAT
jgi:5-formyltetrahydrofolate cyclo-ligase